MEFKSRPPGSGALRLDLQLFDQIDALIRDGQAATPEEAGRNLADAGKVWGAGTAASKGRRLARRYREHRGFRCLGIPSPDARSSASREAMTTTGTPQEQLTARVEALEAQLADTLAFVMDINAAQQAGNKVVSELADTIAERLERTAESFDRALNERVPPVH